MSWNVMPGRSKEARTIQRCLASAPYFLNLI